MEIKYNPTFTITEKEDATLSEAYSILNTLVRDMRSHEILSIEDLTLGEIEMAMEALRKAIEIGGQ